MGWGTRLCLPAPSLWSSLKQYTPHPPCIGPYEALDTYTTQGQIGIQTSRGVTQDTSVQQTEVAGGGEVGLRNTFRTRLKYYTSPPDRRIHCVVLVSV